MAVNSIKLANVTLTVDNEGYREYKAAYKVTTDDNNDGPYTVYSSPLLPQLGSAWSFGNDVDPWVWCREDLVIQKRQDDDSRDKYWLVDALFSNRPNTNSESGCANRGFDNPLDKPAKWSGSFFKYTETGVYDRFGVPILTSSHEQIFGPNNEWDRGRPVIRIEHNTPNLDLALLCALIDTVNSDVLWGFPARTIKLSQISWSEEWYGTCGCYYRKMYEFEVNFDTWDRDLLDEGTKVLNGEWDPDTGYWVLKAIGGDAPDYTNPNHFTRAIDRQGNPIKMLLDGEGEPADVTVQKAIVGTLDEDPVGEIHIEKYYGADLLLLGIPTGLCSFGTTYTEILKSSSTGTVSLQSP